MALGIENGKNRSQFFRIDYHGAWQRGTHPESGDVDNYGTKYFQTGDRMTWPGQGQSQVTHFHYHITKQ